MNGMAWNHVNKWKEDENFSLNFLLVNGSIPMKDEQEKSVNWLKM